MLPTALFFSSKDKGLTMIDRLAKIVPRSTHAPGNDFLTEGPNKQKGNVRLPSGVPAPQITNKKGPHIKILQHVFKGTG